MRVKVTLRNPPDGLDPQPSFDVQDLDDVAVYQDRVELTLANTGLVIFPRESVFAILAQPRGGE